MQEESCSYPSKGVNPPTDSQRSEASSDQSGRNADIFRRRCTLARHLGNGVKNQLVLHDCCASGQSGSRNRRHVAAKHASRALALITNRLSINGAGIARKCGRWRLSSLWAPVQREPILETSSPQTGGRIHWPATCLRGSAPQNVEGADMLILLGVTAVIADPIAYAQARMERRRNINRWPMRHLESS